MEKIFSYGTLMFPEIQIELFGRIIFGYPDKLIGYKKTSIMIEGEKYPCIELSKDSEVDGFILEITKEELIKVDEYEGNEYKRKMLHLKSGVMAWVFVGSV